MLGSIAARLDHYMTLLSTRQRLVAANIANLDTPGYQTRDIDFHFEFMSASRNEAPPAPAVREVTGLKVKQDGNNVSMDREARLLAENALRFNVASSLLRSEIRAVRSAIQEGRGG
jgi:flagellar basal-body rod protein FlgB